ncbi:MAG TPA: haloacid dehalogenase type II [Cytophagales bacterium]|nr:haloacid dehalogenase type II [Cytophagales bacterium]HAA21630.1 haloacid dehalogenase type II [Cytophagales bacterium]HAP60422.1 haloacid dehalogenase type II [Cytophagales bacterium]
MKQLWTDPQYQLFVFDAYGTLFRVSSDTPEIKDAAQGKSDEVQSLWREKQLEYTRLRSMMGRWADFDQITEDALDYALEACGLPVDPLKKLLLDIYQSPSAFPDVLPFLEILKEENMPAVILSNGTHEMLEHAVKATGAKGYFRSLLSAEDVEVYKPSPLMYRLVQQMEKVQPEEVVFFSSNPWDIAGAGTAGFTTVWVNRQQKVMDRLGVTPTFEIADLEEAI